MTTILIADDNPQNLYLLESILKGCHFEVVSAKNGADALDNAREHPPDLIIADILMPVMDGFELCRRWKADELLKQIPFMFYTATYTDPKDEMFAMGLGAERFVKKPQKPEVLGRIVVELLDESTKRSPAVAADPSKDEREILQEYNEVLFRKLEKKVTELEREISRRRQAEEDLRVSEINFRTVVESVPDFILIHREGIIIYITNYALSITGYERQELIGQPVSRFIAPEFRDKIASAIRTRMHNEPVDPYEIDILTKTGSRMTVTIRGSVIEFAGAPALLNVLTDITRHRRHEEEIKLANRKLALLSDVTYQDIRNKITVVMGYLDLSEKPEREQDRPAFMKKSMDTLRAMQNLIKKTHDYQQMGVNRVRWISLEKIIREQFSLLSRNKAVSLEINLNGLEIYSDPFIEQVFFNLMDNAVKHGGGLTRISFSCEDSPYRAVLVCEDDGTGIPDDKKSGIFNRIVGGDGKFGMFFIREFLDIAGMGIAETGVYGKGARFEITIPPGLYRFNARK